MSENKNFRNTNSVNMKLGNFQAIDPSYTNEGKIGLARGGKLDRTIWDEFAYDPVRLAELAKAIRAVLDLSMVWESTVLDDDVTEALEGKLLTRFHRYRERDRGLRTKKLKNAIITNGCLRCEACGFDFKKVYGEHGAGFIEVHHLTPLHQLAVETAVSVNDLALVCANCHRMIHARRPWLSMTELKDMINIAFEVA